MTLLSFLVQNIHCKETSDKNVHNGCAYRKEVQLAQGRAEGNVYTDIQCNSAGKHVGVAIQ